MKRILVALDASSRAPLVLEAAVRLAEMTGSKLVLYRAISVQPDLPRDVLAVTKVTAINSAIEVDLTGQVCACTGS